MGSGVPRRKRVPVSFFADDVAGSIQSQAYDVQGLRRKMRSEFEAVAAEKVTKRRKHCPGGDGIDPNVARAAGAQSCGQ